MSGKGEDVDSGNAEGQSDSSASTAMFGGVTAGGVLKGGAILIGLYISMRLLWSVYALAILTFLGVLFGIAVSKAVRPMSRFKVPITRRLRVGIPPGLAAGFVVLGAIAAIVGIVAWSAPTLATQFGILRDRLPQAIENVDAYLATEESGLLGSLVSNLARPQASATGSAEIVGPVRAAGGAGTGAEGGGEPGTVSMLLARIASSAQQYLFPFISSAFIVVGGLLLVIMIAIYVAADPELYKRGMLHLVPDRHKARVSSVLSAMALTLTRWLRAQAIGMVVIGVVTTVALQLLGIPAAIPLGLLAGVLEFIPNVGPVIAAGPAILMGFIDGPEKALTVAIVYFAIQQLEAQLLIPILMQETVDLPPVLTILAQALMAIVFGFLGLLVAVPALAVVMVAVKMFYVEGTLRGRRALASEPEKST